MPPSQCLSVLELLEFEENETPAANRVHVEVCPRCRALLTRVQEHAPELADELRSVPEGDAPTGATARSTADRPSGFERGQLWTARGTDPAWRYVVAVLGKPRSELDLVIVAPVAAEVNQATDLDLKVADGPLGYPHLILVWQHGPIFSGQLDQYLGKLPSEGSEQLWRLYLGVVRGQLAEVEPEAVGTSLAGEGDPRRRFRSEQLERFQPLWQPVRTELAGEDEQVDEAAEETSAESADQEPALAALFDEVLSGAEWDRVALCEAAGLETEQWQRFSVGHLELTDQTDVIPLARVFSALGWEFGQVREPVRQTLRVNPGGQRLATGGEERLAARSSAGISEEQRQRDIQRGRSQVDQSPAGREGAIASYLRALEKAMDELS
jgi:hypothetical protein